MRVVVALGGNALLKRGRADDGRATSGPTCASPPPALAAVGDASTSWSLSHGNGPQVGLLALQAAAYTEVEAYPLDVLGAQTEGMIGYVARAGAGQPAARRARRSRPS